MPYCLTALPAVEWHRSLCVSSFNPLLRPSRGGERTLLSQWKRISPLTPHPQPTPSHHQMRGSGHEDGVCMCVWANICVESGRQEGAHHSGMCTCNFSHLTQLVFCRVWATGRCLWKVMAPALCLNCPQNTSLHWFYQSHKRICQSL